MNWVFPKINYFYRDTVMLKIKIKYNKIFKIKTNKNKIWNFLKYINKCYQFYQYYEGNIQLI